MTYLWISSTAENHFDQLWKFFNKWWTEIGGAVFRIYPLKRHFSNNFADSLTKENAGAILHWELAEWGRIERMEPRLAKIEYFKIPARPKIPRPRKMDSEHEWSRAFVKSAFYNLCCLATYGKTIEELIFDSNQSRLSPHCSIPQLKSFAKLMSFNKSFLLAEWVQRMIFKAISNDDKRFFQYLSKALVKDAAKLRFITAKVWLGTALLWYLGGKDIRPRQKFLQLLQNKEIISRRYDELSFRAMLGNLGLTKRRSISK